MAVIDFYGHKKLVVSNGRLILWGSMKSVMFLVMMVMAHQASASCNHQDSITVDGVPLVLDLDLRLAESTITPHRAKVKGRSVQPIAVFGVSMLGWRQISDAAGVPLSERVGASIQPAVSAMGGAIWKTEAKQWKLEAEWGVHRALTMDILSLDDSAFAIEPNGQGGLEQWVQRTYELGVELDTLPVSLTERAIQMGSISLSMGSHEPSRKGKAWTWWGGVHVKWSRLNRSPFEVERIPAFGMPDEREQMGSARQDWVPFDTWALGGRLALERRFDDRWSSWLRGEWSSGLRSHWAIGVGVSCRFAR